MKISALFSVALVSVLLGCFMAPCEYKVLQEQQSPDRRYIATVSECNCGATTDYSVLVELRKASTKYHGGIHDQIVFSVKGQHEISVLWLEPDKLWINRPPTHEEYINLQSWNGINIIYENK